MERHFSDSLLGSLSEQLEALSFGLDAAGGGSAGSLRRSSFIQTIVRQTEDAVAPLAFSPRSPDLLGSQDEFKDLRREKDHSERAAQLEEQVGHYQKAVQKLQEVIIMAAQHAQAAAEKSEELAMKLDAKRTEAEHLQNQYDQTKHIYDAEMVLREEMKNKLHELEEQVVHLQETKRQLQSELRKSEMEMTAERRNSFVLQDNLGDLNTQLRDQLTEYREKLAALERERAASENFASQLRVENARLKHVADAAKSKNSALSAEVEELASEVRALRSHAAATHRSDLGLARDEAHGTPVLRAARHSPPMGPTLGDMEMYQMSDDEEKVPSVMDDPAAGAYAGDAETQEEEAHDTALDLPESVRARQFLLDSLDKVESALTKADAADATLVAETCQQLRRDLGLVDEDADLLDLAAELGEGAFYVDVEEQRAVFFQRPQVDLSKKKEQVLAFFERYAIAQNWGTAYGTPETFKLHFIAEQDDVEAPACFVLPVTMFLAQVIGAGKPCEEFDEFSRLEFDEQAAWLAGVYRLMHAALRAKSTNDDLYAFLFHFLAFLVCQFPQIEATLGTAGPTLNPRHRRPAGQSSARQARQQQATQQQKSGLAAFFASLFACFKSPSSRAREAELEAPTLTRDVSGTRSRSAAAGSVTSKSRGSAAGSVGKKRSKAKRKGVAGKAKGKGMGKSRGSAEYLYSAPGGSTHAITYDAGVGSDSEVHSDDEKGVALGFVERDVGDEIFSDDSGDDSPLVPRTDAGEAPVLVYDEPSVSDGDVERVGLVHRG